MMDFIALFFQWHKFVRVALLATVSREVMEEERDRASA